MPNDNLPPMAFKDRCTVAVECLPNAPYRTMLANLLDEMLAAVEKDRERKSVPAGFDEWAKSQGYGPSMLRTHAQAGWNAAMLAAAPQPQPDRQALQAEGKHPAPCARFCEATAFNIKIRGLEAQLKALAQPQPVQPAQERCTYCDGTGDVHSITGEWRGSCGCEAGKAQPEPVQEPVAWRILDKDPLGCGDDRWVVYTQDDFKPGVCPTDYFNIEPLYTSPQAQPAQPLSDELIEEAAPVSAEHAHSFKRGVRFAETKHSIPKGTT